MRLHRRHAIIAAALALCATLVAPTAVLAEERQPAPTIVDLAIATPELSTLVDAVVRAGFVEVLSDRSASLTVFAPTNDAFADLLAQLGLSSLDDIPVETLQAVLLDHVLDFKAKAKELAAYDRADWSLAALGGLPIDFDRSPAGVNNAGVLAADIIAANGVVHVIDTVLVEPDPRPSITELAITTPDLSILVDAVVRAGLAETLSSPGPFTVFAPTNDAFVALLAQLGLSSLDEVPIDVLTAILLDHVVAREYDAVDVLERAAGGRKAQTIGGLRLNFNADPLTVNGVNIVAVDVEASNGTVHVIDAVLLDPSA